MADALLHYGTSTSPTPLEAGSSDRPSFNTINLTATPPSGQQVYCDKIDVALPASAPEGGGAYFTEVPDGVITGGNWKPPAAQLKSGRELGLAAAQNYFHIVFEPPVPDLDLVDGTLSFAISGNLATTATGSPLVCSITETSGTTSGSYSRKGRLDLTLPTGEPVFYLHSLLAVAPDKPTVPRTKFNAGDEVVLSWESNGSAFQLYDGDGTSLYEGVATSCSIPADKVVNDTTYTLKATLTSATPGAQPANLYATLTLTVTNPTLRHVTVIEELVATDLTVPTKLTTSHTDGLRVSGSMTAESTLSVSRKLDAHDVGIVGGLSISGGLAVEKDLTVWGKANLRFLFGGAVALTPTLNGSDIPVYSDGILLVFADLPGRYVATFHIKEEGSSDTAYEVNLLGSDTTYTIPLRRGQRWCITNIPPGSVRFSFYWFSFS
ncbi:hypothetical protein [Nonomuraea typhae]|uniref:Ig-like domain repeat protein n=1 Tax=Nonomuraea typhae TaxID=2603600 RepID=A0ABW7YQ64_9ACTN